jgi:hypothetical protein
MIPALIATLFVGLLIVAATAAALSGFLFRNAPPLQRSALTALAAWIAASAAVHFLPSAYEAKVWERPLFLFPFAIVVWLLMWRSFSLYWQDDAEIEAEAAAEEAKVWPALAHRELADPAAASPAPWRSLWAIRHWRGEIRLPVAYWVNSVMVVFLVTVLAGAGVRGIETAGAPLQAVSAAALLFLIGTLLLWLWGAVGTWRSATCHEDHGGKGGWAIAAQVMVVFGAFLTFLQVQSYAYQSIEYGVLAFGGDSLGDPAQVTLEEDGTTIRIDGLLTSGTSGRFRALAGDVPRLRTVLLDSAGGRQMEAMRIAEAVKDRGLRTRVERECMSACTFILLAGRERTADPSARIGFHQPDFPGWSEGARRMAIREMGDDYRKAGLSGRFVDQAMATPTWDMWMPHHEELAAAQVLTARESDAGGAPRIFREMAALADRLNARLPARIDRTTRFDSVEARGAVLVHRLTVLRPRDAIDRRAARYAIGPAVMREVCAVEANLDALEDGAAFVYIYRDSDLRPLFQINVASCGA